MPPLLIVKSPSSLIYLIFGSWLLKEKHDDWKEAYLARVSAPIQEHLPSTSSFAWKCASDMSRSPVAARLGLANPKFANPGLESLLRRYTNVPACPPTQWPRL